MSLCPVGLAQFKQRFAPRWIGYHGGDDICHAEENPSLGWTWNKIDRVFPLDPRSCAHLAIYRNDKWPNLSSVHCNWLAYLHTNSVAAHVNCTIISLVTNIRDIEVYLPDTIVSQWSYIQNENINLHIKTLKKGKMYKFET